MYAKTSAARESRDGEGRAHAQPRETRVSRLERMTYVRTMREKRPKQHATNDSASGFACDIQSELQRGFRMDIKAYIIMQNMTMT